MAGSKRVTTVRLGDQVFEQLKHATYVLGRSQSNVMEEALTDFFRKHNLTSGYQLSVTSSNVVLLRTNQEEPPEVLEVMDRNGKTPTEIAHNYRIKLGKPVRVVVQET